MSNTTEKQTLNEARIRQAMLMLEKIVNDSSIPRNIRRAAINSLNILRNPSLTPGVKAANTVSILDEVTQDPNMPMHARTAIWNVIAVLSTVRD